MGKVCASSLLKDERFLFSGFDGSGQDERKK
jgi:hypothetical protein